MELPLFISNRRIEISLTVLPGLVPFQQHIEELGVVIAGTIQTKTKLPIDLIHMDPVGFFQVEEHVHEAYVSVVIRIGNSLGPDLEHLCYFLNHVLLGWPAVGFILGDSDISRPLRDQMASTLAELKRIEVGQAVDDELLDVIRMMTVILGEMKKEEV